MIAIGSESVITKDEYRLNTAILPALAALLFFLMLVLPTTFQLERGILLAGLGGGGLIAATTRWRVSRDILMLWLLTLSLGGCCILWGFVKGAPGALRVSTVYILWPIVYMLFVGLVHSPRTIVLFERTLVFGVTVSCLMAIALLFGAVAGQGQLTKEILSFQGAGIGLYDGFIELTLFNLTTVIYGLPYLAALLFTPQAHGWLRNRTWVGLVLLLVLVVCVVSGRRAFWLMAVVTPVLIWGLFLLAGIRIRMRSVSVAIMSMLLVSVGGVVVLGLDFNALSDKLVSAFDYSGEQSASIRYQQFEALMSGWSDSPLIGQGLGAAADSFVSSEEQPWAYELSYVDLLFQTGLLGVIIYSSAVLWVFYAGIKLVRLRPGAAQVILPLLAGLAGFLLVNATNPYLWKFDYLWTIFLPVAAINAYKTGRCI